MPTLATYNANNFFLRYKFAKTFTGDTSKKSEIEAADVGTYGYIPAHVFAKGVDKKNAFLIWDRERRLLAARALAEPDGKLPDILCLQEVENLDTLRAFNAGYLGEHYPYLFLVDGWDMRNIDVGIMSRFPLVGVRTHIDDLDPTGERLFSRDCLEVTIALPGGEELTLFVNHLKSKLVDTIGKTKPQIEKATLASHERRKRQAARVAKLIAERFAGQEKKALFAAIGDLNDTPRSPWVRPLAESPLLVDVLAQTRAPNDCWTYYYRSENRITQIDYVLCSPALAKRVKKSHIERRGLAYSKLNAKGEILPAQSRLSWIEDDGLTPIANGIPPEEKIDFRFPRYPEVLADWKHNVSDHCPVRVWF